ncbi:MAG: lysylphosphatidylglycerol synthase transmembrane domain-containing protein [Thermoanaerobaculia bacterium]
MAESAEPADASSGRRPTQWWRWVLGLGILATMIGVVGPGQLFETFARIDPGPAIAVIGLSLVWLGLAGLNVWVLLRPMTPIRLSVFLPVYATSWAASQLLPGQLGDATQVLLLRKHGVPAAQSGAAYLVDKAASFAWMSLVALYGVGRYTPGLSERLDTARLATFLLAGVVAVGLGIVVALRLPARDGGLAARLQGLLRHTLAELGGMRGHPGALALNLSLTLIKWAVMAAMYVGAFRAFGTVIAVEPAAIVPVMSSLVGYLPITVGGAGTMEITGIYLFGRLGIEAATVLAVYLFFRVELLVIALLLAIVGGGPGTGSARGG